MSFDVTAVRACFPALAAGTAHFDGPGGSQTPDVVADAVRATLTSPIANRGSVTAAELLAEQTVVDARHAMAQLLNADADGIVFGRSMTQLTFDFARALAKDWGAGDEVVVSRLDHDANVRPWLIAAATVGATVRWIDFDPDTAELDADHVQAALSERTKLLALTGASNLIGTRPDLRTIGELAHAAGALFYVDGVHLAAHAAVDVRAMGADLFACSPYKFFGPHCGVLAGDVTVLAALHPDKLLPSSDAIPERFELGTLPYELLAGTTAAVDFIAGLDDTDGGHGSGERRERLLGSFVALEKHEDRLRRHIEAGVAEIGGITNHSRASERTPTMLFTFDDGRSPELAYRHLAGHRVNAPAGTFYAYEPARRLGLTPDGGLRVGLAPYNNDDDAERLLAGLRTFARE